MSDHSHLPTTMPDLLVVVGPPDRTHESLLDVWGAPGYLALDGELCVYSTECAGAQLNSFLTGDGGDVVLDLSRLRFVDSSGVRLLQSMSDRLTVDGRVLHVHGPGAWIRKVLHITGASLAEPCHVTTSGSEAEARASGV